MIGAASAGSVSARIAASAGMEIGAAGVGPGAREMSRRPGDGPPSQEGAEVGTVGWVAEASSSRSVAVGSEAVTNASPIRAAS